MKTNPFSLLNLFIIASLSLGVPSTAVYLVSPLLIASIAAFLTLLGVSKSGSPAPKEITSTPFSFNSLAFCVTAIVGEGFILDKELDKIVIKYVCIKYN